MLAHIWKSRWPLLAFALSFQLLENLLFTPTMGLIGRLLQGQPVVDSTALVQFLLSPRGFLVLFLGATISLTIRLVEHAGLSAMVLGALEGKTFRAFAAFRWLLSELPRLAAVGARMVAWGLVLATPPLAVAGVLAPRLLTKHDVNYYLANRPSEFVSAAVVLLASRFQPRRRFLINGGLIGVGTMVRLRSGRSGQTTAGGSSGRIVGPEQLLFYAKYWKYR
jgi:glycerophosphoryl diester phosphodiesterase